MRETKQQFKEPAGRRHWLVRIVWIDARKCRDPARKAAHRDRTVNHPARRSGIWLLHEQVRIARGDAGGRRTPSSELKSTPRCGIVAGGILPFTAPYGLVISGDMPAIGGNTRCITS